MLLIPIKTDCPRVRRPLVNYGLIALNTAIFIFFLSMPPRFVHALYDIFSLNGANPKIYQFITYAFLHAGWAHLIGNMLFLYIFGNCLNDKLGHLEYLLFYLAGAVVSGAGYSYFTSSSLVGASGAIAAVTTGFLVLFPRSNILVFIWLFYFIDTFEISSLYLIGLKIILWDNVIGPRLSAEPSNVAYGAHLVGYFFGFVVALLLLAIRALDRDQFDILALWSRLLRRHQYAQAVRANPPYGIRVKQARPVGGGLPDQQVIEPLAVEELSPPIVELRKKISDALARFDLPTAAEGYRRLIVEDPAHVLPRREQLDVANQLMAEQDYSHASDAYEKYLSRYPAAYQIEQVQLLLGIIYSRYLTNPTRARELLEKAKIRLKDHNQLNLCEAELRKLSSL